MDVIGPHWWLVNIGSGDGLGFSGNIIWTNIVILLFGLLGPHFSEFESKDNFCEGKYCLQNDDHFILASYVKECFVRILSAANRHVLSPLKHTLCTCSCILWKRRISHNHHSGRDQFAVTYIGHPSASIRLGQGFKGWFSYHKIGTLHQNFQIDISMA